MKKTVAVCDLDSIYKIFFFRKGNKKEEKRKKISAFDRSLTSNGSWGAEEATCHGSMTAIEILPPTAVDVKGKKIVWRGGGKGIKELRGQSLR